MQTHVNKYCKLTRGSVKSRQINFSIIMSFRTLPVERSFVWTVIENL